MTMTTMTTMLLGMTASCINPTQPPLMTMMTMTSSGMMASSCAGVILHAFFLSTLTSLPLCHMHNSQCIYCPVPLPTTCC
ncbi:hypothetical protein EDC04DRAFT_2689720 [Pisolithus marmoratus]|nr:hypothetical protein EDC04DRAFT_2689720 [Pisolithus marmoratus]